MDGLNPKSEDPAPETKAEDPPEGEEPAEPKSAADPSSNNVVLSTHLYKKQAQSFHNSNTQNSNHIKVSGGSTSQTPPFN